MKTLVLSIFITLFSFGELFGQHPLLQSGPMPGYAEMREVALWLQTKKSADVFIKYHVKDQTDTPRFSSHVRTSKENAFTAVLIADTVVPGKRYSYRLFIDGMEAIFAFPLEFQTPPLWRWRTEPPEFTMLTGSCAYINQPEHDRSGTPYGGDYRIFENMARHQADFMVWLGDNIYLREPDWNSKTGIDARYTHTRSIPEMQAFLASTHHYAIWDDHDFGPNDSDKGFFNKDKTLDAFKYFWANPGYGTSEMEGAITSFQWGDADFFLLDNRWYRDPDLLQGETKTILGQKQLQWLLNNLVTSNATFKVVAMGGQFLSTAGMYESYTANGFANERQVIIDFICQHQIKNVIFLTGDVHFTELSKLKEDGKPAIWDFTFSTMSAGPNTRGNEWKNQLRVQGTVVTKRNFGKIGFRGKTGARELVVECFDTDNQLQWQKIIQQE